LQLSFLDFQALEGSRLHITCAKHNPVHRQNAANRCSLRSFACICYATNMSGNQVLQGAQNFVISGCTFNAADTVRDALRCFSSHANQRYLAQINYNTSDGNRATSDAAIPVKPNSSIRFTGRADVLAKLKEHFTTESNDKLRRRKFFLLYGMGGIGKTQICLRFIEEMSD
jgi:hypothetical protein